MLILHGEIVFGSYNWINFYRLHQKSRYNERTIDTLTSVEYFDMYENQYTTGAGVNIKLGAIYRASENLRLGAAWHSPTLNEMHDEWEMVLEHNIILIVHILIHILHRMEYMIILSLPNEVYSSAAIVLDNILLSGDLEYVDYATMRLDAMILIISIHNKILLKVIRRFVVNARFGVELNLSPFVIRAGYSQLNHLIQIPQHLIP